MIPLVEQLAATWTSIADLGDTLTEDEWKRPTGCPGWSVQDLVSHLIDFEAFALGRPRPEHAVADVPHAKNDMGRINEIGVDARRARSGGDVLAEFREVTAARLEQLQGLGEEDLAAETQTPIGPGTLRDLLTLRVQDSWSHEQDMRRAVGRPGHDRGAVVETAVRYWSQFLPFAVAKRGGAPDGTTAVFHVGELPPVAVEVAAGRGRIAGALPEDPTVVLRLSPVTFAALVGGRSDAPLDEVEVAGDEALGRHLAANLGFLP